MDDRQRRSPVRVRAGRVCTLRTPERADSFLCRPSRRHRGDRSCGDDLCAFESSRAHCRRGRACQRLCPARRPLPSSSGHRTAPGVLHLVSRGSDDGDPRSCRGRARCDRRLPASRGWAPDASSRAFCASRWSCTTIGRFTHGCVGRRVRRHRDRAQSGVAVRSPSQRHPGALCTPW